MLLATVDAPIYVVDATLLHEIVGFDLHRGAIAAGDRRPASTLAELVRSARRVAVLEGLNDPENLGAIARSARALGIDALVLDPTCIDPYTRRTVRVSMGEILHLRWCRVARRDWPASRSTQLADAGFETWAMTPAPDSADIWTLRRAGSVGGRARRRRPGLSDACAARRRHGACACRSVTTSTRSTSAAAAAVAFAVVSRLDDVRDAHAMSDQPISRFDVPELDELPDDIRDQILAVQEKTGFVPNVFLALARRPDEFRAFFAFHAALMDRTTGCRRPSAS